MALEATQFNAIVLVVSFHHGNLVGIEDIYSTQTDRSLELVDGYQ